MGIKNNTILLYTFRSAILGRGKLAQMNSGYFPRWRTTRHSFPDPLNFSRWWSSQISYPGDRCGCQNPNLHALLRRLIPVGCPPPILGKTIDRCIMPRHLENPKLEHMVLGISD